MEAISLLQFAVPFYYSIYVTHLQRLIGPCQTKTVQRVWAGLSKPWKVASVTVTHAGGKS